MAQVSKWGNLSPQHACARVWALRIIPLQCIEFSVAMDSYYRFTSSDITFPSGSSDSTAGCVSITILDDTVLEENQAFTVTLTTSDPDVLLGNNVTVITIEDNDGSPIEIVRMN